MMGQKLRECQLQFLLFDGFNLQDVAGREVERELPGEVFFVELGEEDEKLGLRVTVILAELGYRVYAPMRPILRNRVSQDVGFDPSFHWMRLYYGLPRLCLPVEEPVRMWRGGLLDRPCPDRL